MAVIILTSAHGSPGVTSTALGLSLCWPTDSLLVDADRQPQQTVEAGFLHGAPVLGRGMAQIARAHRERRPLDAEVRLGCVELGDGSPERRFLPGFTHPAAAGLFGAVWEPLAGVLGARSATGEGVWIDTGRVGEGIAPGLLGVADAVLLVTRSSLRDLAALRLHLPLVQTQLEQHGVRTQLGLVVVGADQPYSSREIAQQFGIEVWATLPWDPAGARVWSDGEPPRRGRAGLQRGVRALGEEIAARTHLTQVRPVRSLR